MFFSKANPEIKRLSKTAFFQQRRQQCFNENPLCVECLKKGIVTAATVADHKIPHRGDTNLFLHGELQSLCDSCHSSIKQQEESRGYSVEIGEDGWPVDSNHPFNTGVDKRASRTRLMTHPVWFRKSYVPLTIVCGAPASGKTTYVEAHADKTEDRVICFDSIASKLLGKEVSAHTPLSGNDIRDILRLRNDMLGDLMRASARGKWRQAWFIVSEPTAERRQWWHDHLQPDRIVVLLPSMTTCLERAKARAQRINAKSVTVEQAIAKWYASYTSRAGDLVVK